MAKKWLMADIKKNSQMLNANELVNLGITLLQFSVWKMYICFEIC